MVCNIYECPYFPTADQTKKAIGSNSAITTDPPYAAILALPAEFLVFLASGSIFTFNWRAVDDDDDDEGDDGMTLKEG